MCLDRCFEISTPDSAITFTAVWFMPWGSTPAENASTWLRFSARAHPSAICERQEFPVQRNKTFSFCITVLRAAWLLRAQLHQHHTMRRNFRSEAAAILADALLPPEVANVSRAIDLEVAVSHDDLLLVVIQIEQPDCFAAVFQILRP